MKHVFQPRHRHFLRAPDGVTESNIAGVSYFPDADGEVMTTSPEHAEILSSHAHRYVPIRSEPIAGGVPRKFDLIETDELGRAQLIQALAERGVALDADTPRQHAIEAAEAWNAAASRARANARPGGAAFPGNPIAASHAAAPAAQPQTPAQTPSTGDEPPLDDYEGLKGYLIARGVTFAANARKVVLQDLARRTHATIAAGKDPKAGLVDLEPQT